MLSKGHKQIELESLHDAKEKLQQIRDDYHNSIVPLVKDIELYHVVTFHKFSFLFHRILSALFHLQSRLTTAELIGYVEQLTTSNFKLTKRIQGKEDKLLAEKDKGTFQRLKHELEELIRDKVYFTILEKNVIKHNLIYELRGFTEKIDQMEFSGEEITKEEVAKMVKRCDRYIDDLTSVEFIDEELGSKKAAAVPPYMRRKLHSFIPDEKKLDAVMKVVASGRNDLSAGLRETGLDDDTIRKVGLAIAEGSELTVEQKEKIRQALGENCAEEAYQQLIDFLPKAIAKHTPEEIHAALLRNGWPLDTVKRIILIV